MEMLRKRAGFVAAGVLAVAVGAASRAVAQEEVRGGYTYVREVEGLVTVESRYNGRVDARRNLPITTGDEVFVAEGGRLEVGLADGNLLHVGGGTRVRFTELAQGEEGDESAIDLLDGSLILIAQGYEDTKIPRVDTEDATVYLRAGARVRINYDPRRGTAVVVREGTADVRTRTANETVVAGRYLMVRGEAEPVVEAGSFSRDRFDTWSADRLEIIYAKGTSSGHVGEEYAADVQSMDGYGDWSYSTSYNSYVWTPRVAVGWTPYSYGSWYYTPLGLSWWSYDPWGWYPHHYGNWFYDYSWARWSWAPGWAYSPAWVYWGYSPGYVGWCPIGWYSYYRPWWNSYYHHWGHPRGGLYVSAHGGYNTRDVDFRGWNFTGDQSIGAVNARMQVTPGDRMADRLGDRVAISSRPIVVDARGGGNTRAALQDYVREAPRVIERTAARDAESMAPIFARKENLPVTAVDALRRRTVVSERGRLAGSTAEELAPRGTTVDRRSAFDARAVSPRGATAERGGGTSEAPARPTGRTLERAPVDRQTGGRESAAPPAAEGREARPPARSNEAPASPPDSWRRAPRQAAPQAAPAEAPTDRGTISIERRSFEERVPPRGSEAPRARGAEAQPGDWRSRPARRAAPETSSAPEAGRERPQPREGSSGDWRARGDSAAARRVIEGAVGPERQSPRGEPRTAAPRQAPSAAPSARTAPSGPPPARDYSPSPRSAPAPSSQGSSSPPPRASSGSTSSRSAPSSPPSSSSGSRPSGGGSSAPRSSGRRH
jgi:hypothetical protein